MSIADFLLLTALEKIKLLITAGADGEAVRKAMKKRRRELAFSCVSSDACRLCGTPAGDFYIAVSGQKFLRIVKGLFSKSPLTGVRGGAPYISRGARGGAPYNTFRCGVRGSAPYISRGARGGASHIPTGARGSVPYSFAERRPIHIKKQLQRFNIMHLSKTLASACGAGGLCMRI